MSVSRAFTLVELLVVMAIIVIIIAVTGPVVRALKGSGDVNSAVYGLAGVFEQARAYALANNTYVYVGLGEFDAGQSGSGAQTVGVGRLAVAVLATRDGTRGYSPYTGDVYTDWTTNYATTSANGQTLNAANLVSLDKVNQYNNVHLIDLDPTQVPASGTMCRPAVNDTVFRLGNTDSLTATPFTYPVGSTLSGGTYRFDRVVQFDPQGEARSIPKTSPGGSYQPGGVPDRIEIAVQPSNGNQAMPTPASQTVGNQFVLQIDGMTGATVIYRP